MSDSGIDPAESIRNIRTIYRDLIADKKIFCHILLNPFPEPVFFLDGPAPVGHPPDLKRRLLHDFTES
jgi:hypothetical protein